MFKTQAEASANASERNSRRDAWWTGYYYAMAVDNQEWPWAVVFAVAGPQKYVLSGPR